MERWYARVWRVLESGERGAEILWQLEDEQEKNQERSLRHADRNQQPRRKKSKIPTSRQGLATRINRKGKSWGIDMVMEEVEADYRRHEADERRTDMYRKMTHTHPFKTNDTKDDRLFQTHGRRNPRAKR